MNYLIAVSVLLISFALVGCVNYEDDCQDYGTVESFTASAGGYGHNDLYTVTLTTGEQVSVEGTGRTFMRTGATIGICKKSNGARSFAVRED